MNRRQWISLSGAAAAAGAAKTGAAQQQDLSAGAQDTPDKFLVKDYRPKSIFRVPETVPQRARFPFIDIHSHPVAVMEGASSPERIAELVKRMDSVGALKTIMLTGAATPERFKQVHEAYAKHPGRFDLWCGLDMTGVNEPGFGPGAVKSLEECRRLGATGVGEISDKGRGFAPARPGGRPSVSPQQSAGRFQGRGSGFFPPGDAPSGPHADDGRMDILWDACARLGMPVNIHVADPIWAYEAMDRSNDGLMTGYNWMIKVYPGMLGHSDLIDTLERAAKKHPRTVFIACHFMNLDYDLTRLGRLFDRYPNLYCDVSARFSTIAATPHFASQFIRKYKDRVLYGTDLTYTQDMFSGSFRILETNDEHFYARPVSGYHWPLYGLGLPDDVLKKVYHDNARKVLEKARNNVA